jgi:O-methyltransferase
LQGIDTEKSLYLDLMKRSLTGSLDTSYDKLEDLHRYDQLRKRKYVPDIRTMLSLKRLNNIEDCVKSVVEEGVPGDLLEAGCWRGGAVIFMKACLNVFGTGGEEPRTLWCADTFTGRSYFYAVHLLLRLIGLRPSLIPAPVKRLFIAAGMRGQFADETLSQKTVDHFFQKFSELPWGSLQGHHSFSSLGGPKERSLKDVEEAFRRYDLFDGSLRFLPGLFQDTLATAPIDRLALLRLDADFHTPTMQVLTLLYDKLSTGGYCIIDDYFAFDECRNATDKFRAAHQITDPIERIDSEGAFWRKTD